jgi:oligopeptide/dipeptide ABC transporter ATP-binding protein
MASSALIQDKSITTDSLASEEVLLRVEDLKTYFFTRTGALKAVDGVSFTVRKGEAVGLVGESGSGKSLTCLSLMRLVPTPGSRIVDGKIWFKDQDLLTLTESEMRRYRGHRMAMIMQDPQTSLNPVLTVGEQLSEPVRVHLKLQGARVIAKVLEALRAVRIPQPDVRMRQYPHQFSGGMRQRAVAAMGLTTHPELLIADEPTTALDVTIQAQFLMLIRNLQQEYGTSVIWVTHDLGLVAQTCDRVNVMYAGRIAESGGVRTIFKSPQHPYTRALLASVPLMGAKKDRLYQIEGQPPAIDDRPSGCPFRTRCPHAMPICEEQYPPRTSLGGDDFVHCWLAESK